MATIVQRAFGKERVFYLEDAIKSLTPEANFLATDPFDPESIQWFSENIPRPSNEAIVAEMQRLADEWANKYYQLERGREYPVVEEQLDMLWHAMDVDETKRIEPFYSSIKEIKDKYPKPQ